MAPTWAVPGLFQLGRRNIRHREATVQLTIQMSILSP